MANAKACMNTSLTKTLLFAHVGVCRNLKSIVVQIGIEDYFEDPNSPEARKLFDEMVNKLQVTVSNQTQHSCSHTVSVH